MLDTILHQSTDTFNTQRTAADELRDGLRLLEELHRVAANRGFWLYSRPNGKGYESDWRTAGMHGEPRRAWLNNDHLFFGVNPHTEIPATNAKGEKRAAQWVRGTVDNILGLKALFTDIDAKDTISQDEWMPFYVAPDVAGMTKSKARGALQKAQTAAIDAALVQDLPKYKARALRLIQRAALRPSACWDSGGGYQAVWLLDETMLLTDANRAEAQRVQKQWVALIGGDPAASDLNRVLRLPGSVNRKAKYGPAGHVVRFLWCDLGLRYTFGDLAALVPDAPEAQAPKPRRVFVPAHLPAELGDFADVPALPQHPAIDAYNANTDLRALLLELGYTDAGSGRMNRPGGDTAGVQLHGDNTASIYSSADPLYCGHRITPAHALAVFEHNGDVAALLDWLTGGQHARFLAQLDALRLWARTTNFATYAPEHADALRRTDSNDTKVFDALCDLWRTAGSFTTKPVGKKRLAAQAGTSPNAALASLKRLALFAVDVVIVPEKGAVVSLKAPLTEIDPSCESSCKRGQFQSMGEVNEYSPRKARDAYQSGTSRYMLMVAKHLSAADGSTPREWLQKNARRGLGEKGLRIMDAMTRCGEMTVQEMAAETGMSIHAIRDGLTRLYKAGLVDFSQERIGTAKTWWLEPGAYATAEGLASEMRTHRMADSREERRLEQSQLYAQYEHRRAATREDRDAAWRKLQWLTGKRVETLRRLYPGMSKDEARQYAETLPFRQWLQRRAELQTAKHGGDELQEKHHAAMEQVKLAQKVMENQTLSAELDLSELRREAWGGAGHMPEPDAWNFASQLFRFEKFRRGGAYART